MESLYLERSSTFLPRTRHLLLTPAETEDAEDEVPTAATPAENKGPADVGVPTEMPGPDEDAEAPHGEVVAGVKISITTEDPTGVGDSATEVKVPAAPAEAKVPTVPAEV